MEYDHHTGRHGVETSWLILVWSMKADEAVARFFSLTKGGAKVARTLFQEMFMMEWKFQSKHENGW